jgi:hypothetical protein
MLWYDPFTRKPKVPILPLRSPLGLRAPIDLPADSLDAAALRPLMNVVSRFYRQATAEFDEVLAGELEVKTAEQPAALQCPLRSPRRA